MPLNIAFAIPTFNRVGSLKNTIESIAQQNCDVDIKMSVLISNKSSNDETHEFLSNLHFLYPKLDFKIQSTSPEQAKFCCAEDNFASLGAMISDELDWVWWLGDDDYLFSKNSLCAVMDIIKKSKADNLKLIHACQARRSRNTGEVLTSSFLDLSNHIGLHEIAGWMSSLVMDSELAKNVLIDYSPDLLNSAVNSKGQQSAFAHATNILKYIHNKKIAFIDLPLVEPQHEKQTPESLMRWQVENVGERYLLIPHDLELLRNQIDLAKFSRQFFRYIGYSLWDRYISFIIHRLVDENMDKATKSDPDSKIFNEIIDGYWDSLAIIPNMLNDIHDQKSLAVLIDSIRLISDRHIDKKFEDVQTANKLKTWALTLNRQNYGFKTLL